MPPEGACPPGSETELDNVTTAWVWKPLPPKDITSGRRGANRVVTAAGYAGVKGGFSEPNIDEVVEVDNDKGTHQNKPTFYLGVSSGVNTKGGHYYGSIKGVPNAPGGLTKTDAGFQWEAQVSDPLKNPENSTPGWKVFHRVTITTGYTTGGVTTSGSWNLWMNFPIRWERKALGDANLRYQVDQNGYVKLFVQGSNIPSNAFLGPYSTSLQSDENGSVRVNTIEVRRVVGLTQAYEGVKELKPYPPENPTTLAIMDGSVVTKLNFVGGYLTKVADFATNAWVLWPSSSSTDGLYPKFKQDGLWVIDFPTQPIDSNGDYSTGYNAENVEIHMGNPREVEGK